MATLAVRPFEHHVLDFLGYLEFERGLSRNTLEAYRSDLLQLGTYLEREGVDVLDAEHTHLAGFLTDLAAGHDDRPPVAPATLQRKAACLRSFYRHLRREGLLDRDPTADLRAPRKSQKLPHVLGRAEVQRLLAAPRGTDPHALRDRALLEVMYACGLRASEAIDLTLADLDVEAGVLRARGKGIQGAPRARRPRGGRRGARVPAGAAGRRWSGSPTSRTCSSTTAAPA
jgi:integrase/recombinase XerD